MRARFTDLGSPTSRNLTIPADASLHNASFCGRRGTHDNVLLAARLNSTHLHSSGRLHSTTMTRRWDFQLDYPRPQDFHLWLSFKAISIWVSSPSSATHLG